jgi:glycosyltransferase involved in cell wall biosynthesis
MTCNQEKYIAECLQSIVDQKANFDFEVIVADDCSTDRTRQIVEEFAAKYSGLVIPVLHKKNIGVGLNYRSAHDRARGEYVAHCDGDDLWLPGKLAYQADLLDRKPDASQCWGCAYLIDDNGKRLGMFPSYTARLLYPTTIVARDIALSYALVGQHSTQMYRRKFKFNFDTTKPVLDFWIAFNMALNGPAIYSKKILGGYRMTRSPSMTRSQSRRRATVDFLAMHLADIIKMYPQFARSAKSNMLMRKFVSRFRGHDLEDISKNLSSVNEVRVDWLDFVRSISYFLMQKVF